LEHRVAASAIFRGASKTGSITYAPSTGGIASAQINLIFIAVNSVAGPPLVMRGRAKQDIGLDQALLLRPAQPSIFFTVVCAGNGFARIALAREFTTELLDLTLRDRFDRSVPERCTFLGQDALALKPSPLIDLAILLDEICCHLDES
jgi:hypothetical protein